MRGKCRHAHIINDAPVYEKADAYADLLHHRVAAQLHDAAQGLRMKLPLVMAADMQVTVLVRGDRRHSHDGTAYNADDRSKGSANHLQTREPQVAADQQVVKHDIDQVADNVDPQRQLGIAHTAHGGVDAHRQGAEGQAE